MDTYTKKIVEVGSKPIPFSGGVDTVRRKAQLIPGAFSEIQNMRMWHPGMEQRLGYIKGHSTTLASGAPFKSIYHWSKDRQDEKRLFVQATGGDLYETSFTPPAIGEYVFELILFNGDQLSSPDRVTIHVIQR